MKLTSIGPAYQLGVEQVTNHYQQAVIKSSKVVNNILLKYVCKAKTINIGWGFGLVPYISWCCMASLDINKLANMDW